MKCAYCRTERPENEMHQATITFIGVTLVGSEYVKGVKTEKNWYCKDKPCHSHDQMGHEG